MMYGSFNSVLRDRLDYGAQIVEYIIILRDEFEISEEANKN